MKFGVRKPSIKRSISARTTGKIKRSVKKAVNPLYGKKGMGNINDPKKAVYNKVYNKTTVGVKDIINTSGSNHSSTKTGSSTNPTNVTTNNQTGCFRIQRISMVDIIAGERVGVVNGARLGSQRPETPTAQGFSGFWTPKKNRRRKQGLVPVYGATDPRKCRV